MFTTKVYKARYFQFILISALLLLFQGVAFGQHWRWVSSIHGTVDNFYPGDIAVDADGYTYVTGEFRGTMSVGDYAFSTQRSRNSYIVKYDTNGKVIWAKQGGGELGVATGHSIAVDGEGNSYVQGGFNGTVTFGNITLTNTDSFDSYIAKYDSEGNVVWVQTIIPYKWYVYGHLSVDGSGNLYSTNSFTGRVDIGAVTIESHNRDILLLKYNSDGGLQWAKKWGGSGEDHIESFATDAEGNQYVVGNYLGTVTFPNNTYTSHTEEQPDKFIAKFDQEGEPVWGKTITGNYFLRNTTSDDRKVGVDALGNVYVSDSFDGTITLEGTELTSTGLDIFMAKYNAAGELVWANRWGGAGNKFNNGMTVDAAGNSYFTGYFIYNADIERWKLCGGLGEIFVGKANAAGTLEWVISAGGTANDDSRQIAIDPEGNCYIAGLFEGNTEFGGIRLSKIGQTPHNIYLAKLDVSSFVPSDISTKPLSQHVYCAGAPIEVGFNLKGNFTSCNRYTVELSDAYGSFAEPTPIGFGTNSPIRLAIPPTTPPGYQYRIRVNASSPDIVGADNGSDITIDAFPAVPTVAAQGNCEGGVISLLATGAAEGQSYRWYSSATGGEALAETTADPFAVSVAGTATQYYASVVTRAGCEGKRSSVPATVSPLMLDIAAEPAACGTATNLYGFAGLTVKFTNNSTGTTAYLWDFGDGATATEPAPEHMFNRAGDYTVYVTAFYGGDCWEKVKVAEVRVEEKKPVPNVITPDGDAKNQAFVLKISCLPLHLKVYNRWGKLVYDQPAYANNWDGGDLPVGVYYYHLSAQDGQKWKGPVQIIR
ncbi:hypothetical protein D770_06765 [Flammeovirgaceae bacterium 311]|nr:hypothetical protein D770_06765 [Flammeovirgaceae bacterium 311]